MTGIGQSDFLQALGWAVLNSLWQMAVLWVVYQLITGLFRKTTPTHKSSLAAILLVGGFSWFVYTFLSILSAESATSVISTSALVNMESNSQLNDWLYQTLPIASILYLVLLVLPVLHFIRNYRFVQVIRQYGLHKADVEWKVFVKKVGQQMGIRKPVHIWISELVTSPVTIGYLKPVILVPMAAVNNLSAQQLEAVLLHELAHIRRYDYFINLVIKFIQSLLYFNPFVKAFVKIVEREREKSCDEMVIQYQYDPHGYASALLMLEKANHLPKPLVVAAAGKKHDLLNRIEWIMGVKRKPVVSFNKLAGLLAGLLCIIALNALLILSKPLKGDQLSGNPSLASLNSPFYLFTDEEAAPKRVRHTSPEPEILGSTIVNDFERKEEVATTEQQHAAAVADDAHAASTEERVTGLIHPFVTAAAHFQMPEAVVLKSYQEEQVKEAIEATKKIMEEDQWKEVEKKFADVFTEQQKEYLKAEYAKEMSKLDMKRWEDKLRTAYDQVDWEKVNVELGNAVANIRMDSLQHVYTKALTKLTDVQVELKENHITGLPDSDISVQLLEQKKKEMQTAIRNLKAARTRKIVRL